MTICAGMLCTDGIVLCSDSLEAVGTVHRAVNKLVELPIASDDLQVIAVMATDDGVFSDALLEKISDKLNFSTGTFASAKDAIEDATLEYCQSIWSVLDSSQMKPAAEMLIGLRTVDDLRLLHLATPTVRTIETPEFIGYGRELAIYKAGQYRLKDMPTETAAPIIAYIVDVVKNNSNFCGRPTDLAILRRDGSVEHKSQDYIATTTQGYKSIGWLIDTWVFPFLPLIVAETGNDALTMIGKLGEPKSDWNEKIPEILKLLKEKKDLTLAGIIPAIPEKQKQKQAFGGVPFAARLLQTAAKQLHEQNLLGAEARDSLSARCEHIQRLCGVINAGIDSGQIDPDTLRESIEHLCLFFTTSPSIELLRLEMSEDQP